MKSPLPAAARTTAGRRFDYDKSEKGNGTRTTEPAEGVTTLHPPPVSSNLQPGIARSTKLFLRLSQMVLPLKSLLKLGALLSDECFRAVELFPFRQ